MSSPVQLSGLRRTGICRLSSGADEPGWRQQCSHSRMLPRMAATAVSPEGAKAAPPLWPCNPVRVRLCGDPLPVRPLVLWDSQNQAPLAFKDKCSGGLSSQTLRLGSPTWGSELTAVREPLQYNYPPVCGYGI